MSRRARLKNSLAPAEPASPPPPLDSRRFVLIAHAKKPWSILRFISSVMNKRAAKLDVTHQTSLKMLCTNGPNALDGLATTRTVGSVLALALELPARSRLVAGFKFFAWNDGQASLQLNSEMSVPPH
jgi:hypothetical protein